MADQIGNTYSQAAQAQAGYAKGFSDEVQRQLGGAADQSNALLAQNGSPQHVNAPQIGDTLYGLGGYTPATLLNTSGAAAKAAAQQVPTTLRGVGLQGYQAAMNEGTANVAKLEAQRPGLVQTALAGLKADQFDREKFAYSKKTDARDFNYTKKKDATDQAFREKTDARDYNLRAKQFGQQMAFDLAKFDEDKRQFGISAALDEWKAAQPDYQIVGSADGGYYLFNGANGTINTVPGLSDPKPKKNGPRFTASQVQKFKGIASATAKDAFWGVRNKHAVDDNGKQLPGFVDSAGNPTDQEWAHEPMQYQAALAVLMNGTAKHPAVPLAIAQAALNRYWKRAGYGVDAEARKTGKVKWVKTEAGRPSVPFQQRNPKAGAAAEPAAATGSPTGWQSALGPEGAGGTWAPPWNVKLTSAQRTDVAKRALAAVDPSLATRSNVSALVGRMNQESGGQTAIVNKWDSNWQKRIPSIGLLQTIGPTFDSYKVPGHEDIWNPLDNTIAAVRYMLANYKRIVGPSGTGY